MKNALPARYLGTQLDRRYRLERLIGEGASAWVFAAQDLRLEREVAVKLLKPLSGEADAAARRRFVAEGRMLARLVHPHIVLVHDAGETEEGLGYLVMELSDSGNLEGELLQAQLPAEECVRLLLPLMGALASAHDRGVIHRDIKPANIALVRESGRVRAKLLDFGIARQRDAGTTTDAARGTPSYMAPEQARGQNLSPAVDVWALGVVFFRCLSGRLPFEGESSLETMLKLVRERPPHFSEACPGLSSRLAVALDRALEPEPRRRYPDMRSFARALAVACTQDRVALPREPDPIGLPDFARWTVAAEVEVTSPLEAGEPASAAASAQVPSLQVRGLGLRVPIAVGLVVAACALSIWLATAREDQGSSGAGPALAGGLVPRADQAPQASAPAPEPVPTRSAEAIAPPHEPHERSDVSAPSTPQRRDKGKRLGAAAAAQPSSPDALPAGPAPAPAGMITDWNW